MEQFFQVETLIVGSLLLATLIVMAVQRFRVPYTVALVVVVGMLITLQQPLVIEAPPEQILALLIPPLLFEAAHHLNLNELRRNLLSIVALAVPGVLVSTFIVGGLLALAVPWAWPMALVFGALMAFPDPEVVVSLFRKLGVPKRLAILAEGESLLKAGTASVIFNLALVAALTGQVHLLSGIINIVQVTVGGILIGLVLGWLATQVIARVDDYLIEITLTTVLAFGAYLLAERLHVSGTLAVMMAGLISGNFGPRNNSSTSQIVLINFWQFMAFLASLLVFLFIGLQVNLSALIESWQLIGWAILAVLVSRALVIYGVDTLTSGLVKLTRSQADEPIPLNWQHVLNWGGMRGAINLALVLSLPAALGPDRVLIMTIAFGVVLVTLLTQGLTMGPLVRWWRIEVGQEETRHEYGTRRAGITSGQALEAVQTDTDFEAEELEMARREVLSAKRRALADLLDRGVISDDVYMRLSAEMEADITAQ